MKLPGISHRSSISILLILCIGTVVFPIFAQTENPDVTFAPIPQKFRASLIERLNISIEYQRSQQWDRLYDLLAIKKMSKERYIEWQMNVKPSKRISILDFKPQVVELYPRDQEKRAEVWAIHGCAKERIRGREKVKSAIILAFLINGEWYFSHVSLNKGEDNYVRCT